MRIASTFLTIFGLVMTLTFDHLTSKYNVFIFFLKWTKTANLVKFLGVKFMKYRAKNA